MSGVTVGRVLRDRYILEEQLETDGRGAVFKARDRFRAMLPDSHQYVALKVLNVAGVNPEQFHTQLRQVFFCGQVLSHGNVVNVYELDRDGDVFFFTMELLDGESLKNVLERLRPTPMRRSQAWPLIRQLGAGLAHAHERGVVHGNLTPKNVFITRDGELRILSFGANTFVATSAYASCEQLEGRQVDPSDDLYALACICYELLAGVHPFDSRTATLARDYRVSAVRPHGLSGRQWRTLQKGLSWHRAGRSASVHAWTQRLMSDEERKRLALTPLQEFTQASEERSKLPWRAAAALLLAAALATTTLFTQPSPVSSLEVERAAVRVPAVAQLREVAPFLSASSQANGSAVTPIGLAQAGQSEKPEAGAAPPANAPRLASSVLSVEPSRVEVEDHFAEVRLRRSGLQKGGSFTWWTEPATAKPNVDYVPEAGGVQNFPSTYRSTRLYVKLLPQPLRSYRAYFYVAISQPGHHGRPTVIRRQIWLPVASSLEARR